MSVTISLPNRIERQLQSGWGDKLEQKAVEALAVEGYRAGLLSLGEIAEMLGMSVNDADGFLKSKGLFVVDNLAEIDSDGAVLEDLLAR
jgi:predicted HTH domain antitoxin